MQCVGDWGSALLVLPADQDPVKWGLSTCTKLSWTLHKVLLTNTTVILVPNQCHNRIRDLVP